MSDTQLSLALHAALGFALLVAMVALMALYRGDSFLPTLFSGLLGLVGIVVGYFFGRAT